VLQIGDLVIDRLDEREQAPGDVGIDILGVDATSLGHRYATLAHRCNFKFVAIQLAFSWRPVVSVILDAIYPSKCQ
jgi:hypothetical protein